MKSLYVFFVLALATINGEGYSTKNDNFNIDEVVNNKEQLNALTKCLNFEIACSEVGKDFLKDKEHFPCIHKWGEGHATIYAYETFKKKFDPEDISFDQLEASVGVVH